MGQHGVEDRHIHRPIAMGQGGAIALRESQIANPIAQLNGLCR